MTINFESMNWYLHLLNMSNMTVPPHTQMNVMLKNLLETNILLEFCNNNEWKCSVIAMFYQDEFSLWSLGCGLACCLSASAS